MSTSSVSLQQINPNNFVPLASGQTIRHAHFNDVSFVDLKTEAVIFEHCVFEDCSFASAEFSMLKAHNCQFLNCRFAHAHFNDALFDHCSFYDSKKDKGSDFAHAQLKFAKFLECDLSQANFKYANLFGISIKGCKVLAGDFEHANFANKVSAKVSFAQAEITDSILRFARFVKVYLAHCEFTGNDFTEVDFSNANLSEANLTHCILNGATFRQASLEGAEIQGSDINSLELAGCNLKNLKISTDQCIPFLALFEIEVV